MTALVAFVIAMCIFIFTWAMGRGPLTSVLAPGIIMLIAVAVVVYLPLIKKTIHGDSH
jgi:hypothetical protein